jgi:single-stranded-DNA-specific exonuclease
MKAWIEPQRVEVPQPLRDSIGGHLLVSRTLVRRGHGDLSSARAFLDPQAYTPASPLDFPGMGAAVERLGRALRQGERICVWGDFDVDGQTSTTLLVSSLRDLGGQVSYHIPVRARESHGVNQLNLERIIEDGADLILTCDTGIDSHQAVDYARQRGVDVIISDHHDLPDELPHALAVINPRLLPDGHPSATLPGVGVAYKLAQALYGAFGRPEGAEENLDLAALGIVADIAIQRGDARYLLQCGLEALRATRRLGLRVMFELAELDSHWLSEEHIGFVIGPRLNALGRLADANPVVEFLTTDDLSRARILAHRLEGLNIRRKLLTDQVFQGAQAQIEADPSLLDRAALVLDHPSWPAGVIGIVASRLVERYNKATILIASPPGELARGSARSIEGLHITEAIAEQRDLLEGFGGHPMAAGLSISPENIPEFRRRFSRAVRRRMGGAPPRPTVQIDGYVGLEALSLELVSDLERLGPFGPGNPPLTLASRDLKLTGHRTVGRGDEHLLLTVEDRDGFSRQVVWWQGAGWSLPKGRFDLAYVVRASTYRGQRDVQVEWVDARTLEPAVEMQLEEPAIRVEDFRADAHPWPVLQRLLDERQVQVWREAQAADKVPGHNRLELEAGEALVVWTTPPGPAEFRAALEAVSPREVILFGVDPGMDQVEPFLKRLAGLVKFGLRARGGELSLAALSAACAQREVAILEGLNWLQAGGHIRSPDREGDMIRIDRGEGNRGEDLDLAAAQLEAVLGESAAYRDYFLQADKDLLVQ